MTYWTVDKRDRLRLVGAGRAADIVLSGRVVHAHEALELGLVNAIVPDGGLVDRVLDWVGPIASHPRAAVAAAKKAIVDGLRLPLDEGLRLEGRLFMQLQTSPEAIELEERASQTYASGGSPGL